MASQEQLNGGRPQLPQHDHAAEALQGMARAYMPGLFDFWDFEVTERTQKIARHDHQAHLSQELQGLDVPFDEFRSDKDA